MAVCVCVCIYVGFIGTDGGIFVNVFRTKLRVELFHYIGMLLLKEAKFVSVYILYCFLHFAFTGYRMSGTLFPFFVCDLTFAHLGKSYKTLL